MEKNHLRMEFKDKILLGWILRIKILLRMKFKEKKAIEKNSLMTKFEDKNIWRKIVLRMG